MKTLGMLLMVAVLAVVCYVNAEAVTDRTASVNASGNVTGTTSLSITAPSPANISWSITSADAFPTSPADKKIVISYASNYNPWKIMVYTNNTQVPTYPTINANGQQVGRYSKGGLATAVAADGSVNVVPCKWIAKVGPIPSLPTVTTYNFIKDKRDQDDPATVTNPDGTPAKEDWASSFAAGYTNIAYGGPGGGFCTDPTNSAPGPTQYQGDAINGIMALYIAAGWGTSFYTPSTPAAAGSYSTVLTIELYHE